jgi:predicted DNA-binding protein with PD1-like motif
MQFAEAKIGRVFVLRLQDNDRLPDMVESFAGQQGVKRALCFFLGGVKEGSRIVVGPRNGEQIPPEPVVLPLNGVHESCGLGTIFPDETGKPKLHMHASFGRGNRGVIGCVRTGVDVWRIGEVTVIELLCPQACRAVDKETGFEFLEIK